MSWIEHVKVYQAKHPGMTYGEAMSGAKASWRGSKPKTKKVGKGIIDSIKNALFFPPNKLPGGAQRNYEKLKGATITKIMVNRYPINSMVDKFINLVSLGSFSKAKKELGYDKMFHLSMVLYTNKGRIAVEKNERINIAPGGTGAGESIDIAYPHGDTFASFLAKARHAMGDHRFFQYNAFSNNCQDFILGLLQANGVLTAEAKAFIKQDAESLVKKMPGFVGKVAQAATDLGGKVSQLISGQGRRRKKKVSK